MATTTSRRPKTKRSPGSAATSQRSLQVSGLPNYQRVVTAEEIAQAVSEKSDPELKELKQSLDSLHSKLDRAEKLAKVERKESRRSRQKTLRILGAQGLWILLGCAWGWFAVLLIGKGMMMAGKAYNDATKQFGYNQDQGVDSSVPKVGEKIGSYEVTSGFGKRESPGGIGSTDHKGIDVAMPTGTQIYTPVDADIECAEGGPAGMHAIIKPKEQTGVKKTFLAAHLSRCNPGFVMAGQIFALSGNTGNSTGPHLHWGQKTLGSDEYEPPYRGYLVGAVTGKVLNTTASSEGGKFIESIVRQESGGNYRLVNTDSGALGKYQIMPENVASWSRECIGNSITATEFLSNNQAQDKIAHCKLFQYFNSAKAKGESNFEACRSAAATWYSGSASKKDSKAPQGKYPSIYDYTMSVCGRVR